MNGEVWQLRRGRMDPIVWPFDSEQAAESFKDDHGLIDYRVVRFDDPDKDHVAVCARDHEPWPCRHVRLDRQTRRILDAARNRCYRCGKQVGWMKVTFPGLGELGDDRIYHGKLGACFNEAKRLAAETGDENALRDIERCEESRRQARAHREYCARLRAERAAA